MLQCAESSVKPCSCNAPVALGSMHPSAGSSGDGGGVGGAGTPATAHGAGAHGAGIPATAHGANQWVGSSQRGTVPVPQGQVLADLQNLQEWTDLRAFLINSKIPLRHWRHVLSSHTTSPPGRSKEAVDLRHHHTAFIVLNMTFVHLNHMVFCEYMPWYCFTS